MICLKGIMLFVIVVYVCIVNNNRRKCEYIMQVASWGAYLMSRNIITLSIAPRDTHEAQVQFALERGVPALIAVLASKRLPFPSRSFDMSHCSRCLIPWAEHGIYIYKL